MVELHQEGSVPAACAAGLFDTYLTLQTSTFPSHLWRLVILLFTPFCLNLAKKKVQEKKTLGNHSRWGGEAKGEWLGEPGP